MPIFIISPLLLGVYFFTKLYLKSYFRLVEVTKDLPEKIDAGLKFDWPQSDTLEIHLFTEHFKEVALRLRDMFIKSKELNPNHDINFEFSNNIDIYLRTNHSLMSLPSSIDRIIPASQFEISSLNESMSF